MTALSETKLVFISSGDRKMYTYDTGTKALVEVGTIPFASQGSCRKIVRDDGVTIGKDLGIYQRFQEIWGFL